jgi:hypothetical protein
MFIVVNPGFEILARIERDGIAGYQRRKRVALPLLDGPVVTTLQPSFELTAQELGMG